MNHKGTEETEAELRYYDRINICVYLRLSAVKNLSIVLIPPISLPKKTRDRGFISDKNQNSKPSSTSSAIDCN